MAWYMIAVFLVRSGVLKLFMIAGQEKRIVHSCMCDVGCWAIKARYFCSELLLFITVDSSNFAIEQQLDVIPQIVAKLY